MDIHKGMVALYTKILEMQTCEYDVWIQACAARANAMATVAHQTNVLVIGSQRIYYRLESMIALHSPCLVSHRALLRQYNVQQAASLSAYIHEVFSYDGEDAVCSEDPSFERVALNACFQCILIGLTTWTSERSDALGVAMAMIVSLPGNIALRRAVPEVCIPMHE
eukprot:2018510-Pleurochrysis_carterae.AAC.8